MQQRYGEIEVLGDRRVAGILEVHFANARARARVAVIAVMGPADAGCEHHEATREREYGDSCTRIRRSLLGHKLSSANATPGAILYSPENGINRPPRSTLIRKTEGSPCRPPAPSRGLPWKLPSPRLGRRSARCSTA